MSHPAEMSVSSRELLEAFQRIHPAYRNLQFIAKGGKAARWRTLNTIPETGSGDSPIPLVYLELSHGAADALANFFLTSMKFARERLHEETGDEEGYGERSIRMNKLKLERKPIT